MKPGGIPLFCLLVVTLAGVTTRFSFGSPTAETMELDEATVSAEECPNGFRKFRQTLSWYQARNEVLIEANQACGNKAGNSFSLDQVTLTIRSQGIVLLEMTSDLAIYAPRQNTFLFSPLKGSKETHCASRLDQMQIDLGTGEVRSPGLRWQLDSPRPFHCPRRKTHAI